MNTQRIELRDPRELIPGNKEYYDDLRAVLQWINSPGAVAALEERRREEAAAIRASVKRREKSRRHQENRRRLRDWRRGVAKIMAEVRRREVERGVVGDTIEFLPNPITGCNI